MRPGLAIVFLLLLASPLVAAESQSTPPILSDQLDEFGSGEMRTDPLGFGVWIESLSHTTDINGGTYGAVSAGLFLGRRVLVDLRYLTDLLPTTFNDHLVELSAQINFGRLSPGMPAMTFGPGYLTDVSSFGTNHYVGIVWSVLNSWQSAMISEEFGIYVNILSFRFMWDVTDGDRLFSFTLVEPKFF